MSTGLKRGANIILIAMLTPGVAMARDDGCKTNPQLTGKCYVTRGGVSVSADIGPVLDSDGNRMIVRPAPHSERDMPVSVGQILMDDPTVEVAGTYEVCPIPAQPSQFPPESTHYASIGAASGLSVFQWSEGRWSERQTHQ